MPPKRKTTTPARSASQTKAKPAKAGPSQRATPVSQKRGARASAASLAASSSLNPRNNALGVDEIGRSDSEEPPAKRQGSSSALSDPENALDGDVELEAAEEEEDAEGESDEEARAVREDTLQVEGQKEKKEKKEKEKEKDEALTRDEVGGISKDKFNEIAKPLMIVIGGTEAGDNNPRALMMAEPAVYPGEVIDGPRAGRAITEMGWRQRLETSIPIGLKGSDKADVTVEVIILLKQPDPFPLTPDLALSQTAASPSRPKGKKAGGVMPAHSTGAGKNKKSSASGPSTSSAKDAVVSSASGKGKKRKTSPKDA